MRRGKKSHFFLFCSQVVCVCALTYVHCTLENSVSGGLVSKKVKYIPIVVTPSAQPSAQGATTLTVVTKVNGFLHHSLDYCCFNNIVIRSAGCMVVPLERLSYLLS